MATTVVPKLLNLSAPTLRNQRTLVWLQNQSTMQSNKLSNTVNWSKWDAVVTSISSYNHWSQYNTKIVGIIITELTSATSLDELLKVSKQVPMILISQTVLALKSEQYWTDNFDNVLNLDNILEHYPFINNPWDQTTNDAVAILGLLCRYNRIVDCNTFDRFIKYHSF